MKQAVFSPINLRLDYGNWDENTFTENPNPVFSWAIQSDGTTQKQSACRLRVSINRHVFWDSGWCVQSEQSMTYAGVPLASAQTYTLSLTVKDQLGRVSGTVRKHFSTALLEPWTAEWIAPQEDYEDAAIYFRHVFTLHTLPKSSMLFSCGIGLQQISLNGKRLGAESFLAPAFSDYTKTCYYTAYKDLQKLLRVGENVLCITVAPGWRRNRGEYLCNVKEREVAFMGRPQLTATMYLTENDGSCWQLQTDEQWQVSRGPVQYSNLYQGEHYDARLEAPEWFSGNDVQTDLCQITEAPWEGLPEPGRMRLQSTEPVCIGAYYTPRMITNPAPDVYLFDFGQNIAGVCQLRINPHWANGQQIILRHAERLDDTGRIYTATLRTAAATDIYIANGKNTKQSDWTPAFTYHGFRYVEVSGLGCVPDMDTLRACAFYNAVDTRSSFRCGSAIINQIQDLILATERANWHSTATDCPQRDERLCWLNDATIRFEESPYSFDLGRMLPKIVFDIMDAQRSDGAIPCTAPFVYGTQPTDPVCSALLVAVRQCYYHYGNLELVRTAYPAMRAWNECLYAQTQDDILPITLYGDWASPEDCCMEIAPFSAVTPGAFLSTGYLYYNALLLAEFAELLHMQEEAILQRARAERIRAAMLEKWVQPDGTVASGSQACQAFALWLGVLPETLRPAAALRLHEAVERVGYRITTGNLCTYYLFPALTEYGYINDAYRLITREAYPSHGYMLQHDATTIWERFELTDDPTMNSHAHPMYGAVGAWFYAHLAGITPLAAGFSRVQIRPYMPDDLHFVSAVLPTCKGDIGVKWHRHEGHITLFVSIPVGMEAIVYAPDGIHTVFGGFYAFS